MMKEEYEYDNRGLTQKVSYFDYQNVAGDFWSLYGNGAGASVNNLTIAEDENWVESEWTVYSYTPTGSMESSATYRNSVDIKKLQ